MRKLAERIRGQIAQRKRSRRMTTTLTAIAGILVFLTVYTLILPALALEEEAYCGLKEHEHTDACYEQVLTCTKEEHVHTDACYDEDGNVICGKEEHTHSGKCYKETLTCGKERHVHTEACYEKPAPEKVTKASTQIQEEVVKAAKSANKKDSNKSSDGTTSQKEDKTTKDKKNTDQTAAEKTEAAEATSQQSEDTQKGFEIAEHFTDRTGLWYQETSAGQDGTSDQSGEVWKKVDKKTTLDADSLVRVHFAFQIPKDSLDGSSFESVYVLPDNISITEETAEWLNDDTNAVNQVITGTATPDKDSDKDAYLAGKYQLVQNEDKQWQLEIMWDPYVLVENTKSTLNVWTDMYLTGNALLPQKDGSYEIVFAEKTDDQDKVSVEFAGVKSTEKADAADGKTDNASETKDSKDNKDNKDKKDTEPGSDKGTEATSGDKKTADAGDKDKDSSKKDEKTSEGKDSESTTAKDSAKDDKSSDNTEKLSDNSGNDSTSADKDGKDQIDKKEAAEEAKTLTFDGDDYIVTVSYDSKAQLPEDAKLDVREIKAAKGDKAAKEEYENYYDQAVAAMRKEGNANVTSARFFDITFVSGQKEIEPAAPVSVKIEYKKAEAIDEDTEVAAIHMPEKADSEVLDVEVNTDKSGVKEVEFTADSFSVYGIVYTVDFYYGEYEFHMPGSGSIKLSELFRQLGIDEDVHNVEDVTFTDDTLLKITSDIHFGPIGSYDWTIKSLKPFDTEEALTIRLKEKDPIVINVTDAQDSSINNTYYDASSFITQQSADITEGTEIKYNSSEQKYNANVTYKFVIPSNEVKEKQNFYITLGDDIVIPENALGVHRYAVDHGENLRSFEYWYEKNDSGKYVIKIHYLDAYKAAVDNIGKNTISMDVLITHLEDKDENNKKFEFVKKLDIIVPKKDIEYPGNETDSSDIHTSKAYGGLGTTTIDSGKQVTYAEYTVTISSNKGTPGEISLKDTLSNLYYKLNNQDIKDFDVSDIEIVSVTKNGENYNVTSDKFSADEDKKSFTCTLDQLSANSEYVVTYRYVFTELFEEMPADETAFNLQAGANNSATAESGTIKDTDSDSFNIKKENTSVSIGKSGKYDDDTGKITWTIILFLKQGNHVLADDAFSNLGDSDITISREEGTGFTTTKNGNKITFNDPGTYTITYTTDAEPELYNSVRYNNTAIVDDNPNYKGEYGVNVPASGNREITKSLASSVLDKQNSTSDVEVYILNWDLSFTLPDHLAAGTVLKDKLAFNKNGTENFDYQEFTDAQKNDLISQLEDVFGEGKFDVEIKTDGTYELILTLKEDWNNPAGTTSTANISYSTTATVDLAVVNRGLSSTTSKDRYTNTFSINNVSANAYFTYTKEVNKVDTSHRDGTKLTSHTVTRNDNDLQWAIIIDLQDDYNTLNVTDTLPDGVTVTGIHIGGEYNSDLYKDEDNNGTFTLAEGQNHNMGDEGKSNVDSVTLNGNTLTVNLRVDGDHPRTQYMQKGKQLYIFVDVDVNESEFDAIANQTKQYTNTVSVKGDGDDLGSDYQTQEVTTDVKSVSKKVISGDEANSQWDEFHWLSYQVIINEDGHTMLPDAEPGTTYSMDDVLYFNKTSPDGKNINFMLVPGSVKLQTLKSGATSTAEENWVDVGNDVQWTYQFVETKDGDLRYKTILVSGLPDKTILRLKYTYQIDLEDTEAGKSYSLGDINNIATIHGKTDYSTSNTTHKDWSQFNSTATTESSNSLTLSKVDLADYNTLLPGTKFVLEYWDGSKWVVTDAVSQDDRFKTTENDVGKFGASAVTSKSSYQVYQTASDTVNNRYGTIKFFMPSTDSQMYKGSLWFDSGVVYRAREYDAPSGGYILSSDPSKQPAAYFYFSKDKDGNAFTGDINWPNSRIQGLADDLSVESDTFYITNAKVASLKVSKKFVGDAQPTDAQKRAMKFGVYKSDGTTLIKELTYEDIINNNNILTHTDYPDIVDDGTYIIKETGIDINGVNWTMTYSVNGDNDVTGVDDQPASSSTVNAGEVTITNGVGTVSITNKYENPKTSIKVTKEWLKSNGDAQTNPDKKTVGFQVYRIKEGDEEGTLYVPYGASTAPTYELKYASGEWSELEVNELPLYDSANPYENNTPYKYYVVETNPNSGVKTTYKLGDTGTAGTAITAAAGDSSKDIIIVNQDVSLTVTKKYTDEFGVEKTPDNGKNIQFDIYAQYSDYNGDVWERKIVEGQKIVYNSAAGKWYKENTTEEYTIKLPTVIDSTNPVVGYRVQESDSSASGYSVSYQVNGSAISDANPIRSDEIQTVTIVNADKTPDAQINVKKVWNGGTESDKKPVTVELWAKENQDDEVRSASNEKIKVYVVASYTNGDYVNQEPIEIEYGNGIELTLPDWVAEWGQEYTVYNIGQYSLEQVSSGIVKKKTFTLSGLTKDTVIHFNRNGDFEVTHRELTQEVIDTTKAYRTATLDADGNWSTSFENLPFGYTYFIKETNAPAGFAVSYEYVDSEGNSHTGSDADAANMAGSLASGGVLITNSKNDGTDLTLNKVWENSTGSNSSINYTIYQSTKELTADDFAKVTLKYDREANGSEGSGSNVQNKVEHVSEEYYILKNSKLKLYVDHTWWDPYNNGYTVSWTGYDGTKVEHNNEHTVTLGQWQRYVEHTFTTKEGIQNDITISLNYNPNIDLTGFMQPVIEAIAPDTSTDDTLNVYSSGVLSKDDAVDETHWSKKINVTKYQPDGVTPYYYYVFETGLNVDKATSLMRFSTTYSSNTVNNGQYGYVSASADNPALTITNTQRPEYTWAEVKKEWLNVEDTDSKNLHVVLYRRVAGSNDIPEWYDRIKISKDGWYEENHIAEEDRDQYDKDWTYGWYALESGYEYFIRETDATIVTDSGSWNADNSTDTKSNGALQNYYDIRYTSNGVPLETIKDTEKNVTFYKLPMAQATSAAIITNALKEVRFTKSWEEGADPVRHGGGTNWEYNMQAKVRLERYKKGSNAADQTFDLKDIEAIVAVPGEKSHKNYTDLKDGNGEARVRLAFSPDWTVIWSGLDAFDQDGNPYSYKVVETWVGTRGNGNNPEPRDMTSEFIAVPSASGLAITNYYNVTELDVSKEWNAGDEPNEDVTMTYALYAKEKLISQNNVAIIGHYFGTEFAVQTPANESAKPVAIQKTTADSERWTKTARYTASDKKTTVAKFENLPRYRYESSTGNLYEIEYTVKETKIEGTTDRTSEYIASVSDTTTGTISKSDKNEYNIDKSVTVTNTKKQSVEVSATKSWGENTEQAHAVQFTLYQEVASGTSGAERIGTKWYKAVEKDADGEDITNPQAIVASEASDSKGGYTYTWPEGENNKVTWTNLAKADSSGEIKYYIKETGVYFGRLTVDDTSTEDIDESGQVPENAKWAPVLGYTVTPSADGTEVSIGNDGKGTVEFTNTSPKQDVALDKDWDENVPDGHYWEADFILQELEYPYADANGNVTYDVDTAYDNSDNMDDAWTNVKDENGVDVTWKITSTKNEIEVKKEGLPRFRTKADGKVYILMYSVEETGYKVWTSEDKKGEDPIYSWTKGWNNQADTVTGDIQFTPEYIDDAADATNYEIKVLNSKKNDKENIFIDIDLKKEWVDPVNPNLADDPNSYAEFQLKRTSHQEFKKLNDPLVDYNQFVTVTLTDAAGRVLTSLKVEKNAEVKLQAGFKAASSGQGTLVFVNANNPSDMVTMTNAGAQNQQLVSSTPFRVNQDVTYKYSSGVNFLADGLYGVVISDRCDGQPTADVDDDTFNSSNYQYRINKDTGHVVTYNKETKELVDVTNSNGWTIKVKDLPQTMVDKGLERETTTVYGYYFEEVSANPNYPATLYDADSSGNATSTLNGDRNNRIYFNDSVVAVNKKPHLTIKKYWESLVQSEMPNLVVKILKIESDGNNVNVNGNEEVYKNVILTADNNFEYDLYDLEVVKDQQNGKYWAYVPWELGITTSKPGDAGVDADGTIQDMSKVSYVELQHFEKQRYMIARQGETFNYLRIKADDLAKDGLGNLDGSTRQDIIKTGTGTICIVNFPEKTGFQLAIRKRWHKFTAAGGMTTESDYDGAYFTAMLVQIVKDAQTHKEIKRVDYGDTFEWKYDGNTDFKYKDNGKETNITIRYNNGQWLVVIPEGSGSDGSNLAKYGYYTDDNGEIHVAEYDYTVREVSVTSLDGYHWALSDHVQEGSAQDLDGTGVNGSGHIWMLDNYPDADLKIVKHWPATPAKAGVRKVYFKITNTNGDNIIEDIVKKGTLDEHQLTNADVAKYHMLTCGQEEGALHHHTDECYEDVWCLVVEGATNTKDDWIAYIDHLPLFDFSKTVFGNGEIGPGGMPGEINYNVQEVAAEQLDQTSGQYELVDSSQVYIPYYQVTTRGTKGSIRSSADGIQLGMYEEDEDGNEVLQPTIVEVTNNATENFEIEKKFFNQDGSQVDPAGVEGWKSGGNAISKIQYVVKVEQVANYTESTTTVVDGENKVTNRDWSETKEGYLASGFKNGTALSRSIAESIDDAQVFELTSSEVQADGKTWKANPDALQGLPSAEVKVINQGNPSTTCIVTYKYSIVEKAVYAGEEDVTEYFQASSNADKDNVVWTLSNTRAEPTEIKVRKDWSNLPTAGNGEELSWEATFKVQYSTNGTTWRDYVVGDEVKTYTITDKTSDGTLTVKGLPKYVDDNADVQVPYQYRAVETGYKVTITKDSKSAVFNYDANQISQTEGTGTDAVEVISNELTKLNLVKQWKQGSSNVVWPEDVDEITYTLHSVLSYNDGSDKTKDETIGTVKVKRNATAAEPPVVTYNAAYQPTGSDATINLDVDTTDNNYKVTVPYLPKTGAVTVTTGTGARERTNTYYGSYTYYVTESAPGYEATYTPADNEDGSKSGTAVGGGTITTANAAPSTNLNVHKVWKQDGNTSWDENGTTVSWPTGYSVTYQVYQDYYLVTTTGDPATRTVAATPFRSKAYGQEERLTSADEVDTYDYLPIGGTYTASDDELDSAAGLEKDHKYEVEYKYHVQEVSVTKPSGNQDYVVDTTKVYKPVASGTVGDTEYTNLATLDNELTSLKVKKVWTRNGSATNVEWPAGAKVFFKIYKVLTYNGKEVDRTEVYSSYDTDTSKAQPIDSLDKVITVKGLSPLTAPASWTAPATLTDKQTEAGVTAETKYTSGLAYKYIAVEDAENSIIPNGSEYAYRAIEVSEKTGDSYVLTNDYTDVKIKKEWLVNSDTENPIEFPEGYKVAWKLIRTDSDGAEEEIDNSGSFTKTTNGTTTTIQLNTDIHGNTDRRLVKGNETVEISKLPTHGIKNGEEVTYTYKVVEDPTYSEKPAGSSYVYTTQEAAVAQGTGTDAGKYVHTLTNDLTNVEVTKTWSNNTAYVDKVTVKLYRTTSAPAVKNPSNVTIKVKFDQNADKVTSNIITAMVNNQVINLTRNGNEWISQTVQLTKGKQYPITFGDIEAATYFSASVPNGTITVEDAASQDVTFTGNVTGSATSEVTLTVNLTDADSKATAVTAHVDGYGEVDLDKDGNTYTKTILLNKGQTYATTFTGVASNDYVVNVTGGNITVADQASQIASFNGTVTAPVTGRKITLTVNWTGADNWTVNSLWSNVLQYNSDSDAQDVDGNKPGFSNSFSNSANSQTIEKLKSEGYRIILGEITNPNLSNYDVSVNIGTISYKWDKQIVIDIPGSENDQNVELTITKKSSEKPTGTGSITILNHNSEGIWINELELGIYKYDKIGNGWLNSGATGMISGLPAGTFSVQGFHFDLVEFGNGVTQDQYTTNKIYITLSEGEHKEIIIPGTANARPAPVFWDDEDDFWSTFSVPKALRLPRLKTAASPTSTTVALGHAGASTTTEITGDDDFSNTTGMTLVDTQEISVDSKDAMHPNGWYYKWSDLPTKDPTTGAAYHYYVVEEVPGNTKQVAYTYNDSNNTTVTINNTPVDNPQYGSFKVTKSVEGADTDRDFTIRLKRTKDSTTEWLNYTNANEEGHTWGTEANATTWTINDGGTVTFTGLDLGYEYTVVEDTGSGKIEVAGYEFNSSTTDVTASATVNDATEYTGTITNKYTPKTTTAHPVGTKELAGRQWKSTDEFSFTLTPTGDTVSKIGTDVILPEAATGYTIADNIITKNGVKGTGNNNATITFPDITFKKVGTYTFTMAEVIPETNKIEGITYAANPVTVTVTIGTGDNGDLTSDVSYSNTLDGHTTDAYFINTYDTSVTTHFEGQKEFNGSDKTKFSFTVAGGDATHLPSPTTVNAAADGKIVFGDITYQLSDLNDVTASNGKKTKTYTYRVKENLPSGVTATEQEVQAGYKIHNGIKYDLSEKTVTVTVEYDETTGAMTATVSPETTSFTFTNEELKNFEFSKVWKKADGTTENWPDGKEITVVVTRRIGENGSSDPNWQNTYTIKKSDLVNNKEIITGTVGDPKLIVEDAASYKFVLKDLDAKGTIGATEGEFTYYVTESGNVEGYKNPEYGKLITDKVTPKAPDEADKDKALNGEYIINTPNDALELPHTGGIGTTLFTLIGSILVLLSGALLLIRRRRLTPVRVTDSSFAAHKPNTTSRGGGRPV